MIIQNNFLTVIEDLIHLLSDLLIFFAIQDKITVDSTAGDQAHNLRAKFRLSVKYVQIF